MRYLSVLITAIFLFLFPSQTIPGNDEAPFTGQDSYQHCLHLIATEQYQDALNALQAFIRQQPDFNKPYRKIAEIFILTARLAEGEKYFHQLLVDNLKNPYAFYGLAQIKFKEDSLDQAIRLLKKSISLKPDYGEAYGIIGGLPEVYKAKGDLPAAKRFFNELINKDPTNSYAYYALGRVYYHEYNWEKALPLFEKSLRLNPDLLFSYFCKFYLLRLKSEYKLALETAQQLYQAARRSDTPEMMAASLSMIGQIYFLYGAYRKTLESYNQSLLIARNCGDKRREAGVINDLGALYSFLGEPRQGIKYFKRALSLFRKLGVNHRAITTLYNIGLAYNDLRESAPALDYFNRALQLNKARGFPPLDRLMLTGIAETNLKLKKYQPALDNFHRALDICKQVNDIAMQAYILRNLGSIYHQQGKYRKAIGYHRQSLEIGLQIGDAQIIWEAQTGLGSDYAKSGKTDDAIQHFASAIAIFDSIRKDLNIQSLGSSFLEDKYQAYPSIIELFAQKQDYRRAFQYAEKYKAKALLDLLSSGQFLLQRLLPDSILFEFAQIRSQLESLHSALSEASAATQPDESALIEYNRKISEMELKKNSLINWVKQNKSDYYQLVSADPVPLKELQNRLLQPGEAVIEYIVAPEKISVFLIARDTLVFHTLPVDRKNLEHLLSNLSVIFRNRNQPGQTAQERIWNANLADFSIPPAYQLYEALLQPLLPLLNNYSQLIISPDDLLYYLPFEMLVSDTTGIRNRYDFSQPQFLVQDFDISYVPAVSLLNIGRSGRRDATETILAFGNPTLPRQPHQADSMNPAVEKDKRSQTLSPLPYSGEEVKEIASVFSGFKTRVFTGTRATETVYRTSAPGFQVLHFATHFLVNDEAPLYSSIVLAPDKGSKQDGFLHTYEVFDLPLNADLVVLSACNTALGKLNKGEGLIGITRGFQYAGVPSAVISLWEVDDQSTNQIMKYFYRYLKKGFNKSRALRLAKSDYLKNADSVHRDPYYWAPYILTGNASPIQFTGRENRFFTWLGVILLLLIIPAALLYRKFISW